MIKTRATYVFEQEYDEKKVIEIELAIYENKFVAWQSDLIVGGCVNSSDIPYQLAVLKAVQKALEFAAKELDIEQVQESETSERMFANLYDNGREKYIGDIRNQIKDVRPSSALSHHIGVCELKLIDKK